MLSTEEVEALRARNLCHRCVGDQYLSNEMSTSGRRRKCSYCGRLGKAYKLDELADRVDEVFEQHYVRTLDRPDDIQSMMLADRESDYDWGRDGEPVIQAIVNAGDIPEEAAQDIQAILSDRYDDFEAQKMGEETAFADDSYYEQRSTSDARWQEEWADFETSLKTEARFFNRTGAAHLASVFRGIGTMASLDGRPLIVDAGPGTNTTGFYRARAFQADDRVEEAMGRPDLHLGSPPSRLAAAGRMNAQGVSVFYGASDAGVAIAEVRPPVGSQVAVARFEIVRRLRLLDLTALTNVSAGGSVFDPGLSDRLERATFLGSLSKRITKPVMPDDQAFEYLATQAIADYLATESDPEIDGILFPSVQADGDVLNVVLFHKASRVEALEIPTGTTVEARTGQDFREGWERDYVVIEETPPKQELSVENENEPEVFDLPDWHNWEAADRDHRAASLRIDLGSMRIHEIRRVAFESTAHAVRRHRWPKRSRDF